MTQPHALAIVLEAARAYADDVASGLEDGTYEEGDPATIYAAIERLERPATLAIIVEGGIVQDMVSDDVSAAQRLRVVSIDYDTDDGGANLYAIPQEDGSIAEAHVCEWTVSPASIPLARIGKSCNLNVPFTLIGNANDDGDASTEAEEKGAQAP